MAIFRAFLAALAFVVLAGCSAISKTDAERIDVLWKVIGPRHREYIVKDPALQDEKTKAIRIETLDRMDAAVREALEGAK